MESFQNASRSRFSTGCYCASLCDVTFQELVTEERKDKMSTIPKLLELNLEETHRNWGDEVEDAIRLQEEESGAKTMGADRRQEVGLADVRRYDSGRNRGEFVRADDRPPAKRMKDEPLGNSYRGQRDGAYMRDRTRGVARSRGKADTFRGGFSRGGRSSANEFPYPQGRDTVVSEYQPSRGEKRGTLTFERSDLHPERQTSFDNKRSQYRSGDAVGRQSREDRNREGRGKDGRENYPRKEDRTSSTSKLPEARSSSEAVVFSTAGTFTPSSDPEPMKANAWNLPFSGPKPAQLDEIADIGPWNADTQLLLDSQPDGSSPELRKSTSVSQCHPHDKPEIESQLVLESRGNDRESGRLGGGSRGDSYRSERGSKQARKGRRQNWSEQEGNDSTQRYGGGRRPQPRGNRDRRGPRTSDDVDDDFDEAVSRDDRNQSDRRRSSRYGSSGRGLRQFGHAEYSMRSRGRGVFCIISLHS